MGKRKQVGRRRLKGFCVAVSQIMDEQMTPTVLLDLHRLVDFSEGRLGHNRCACAAGLYDLIYA